MTTHISIPNPIVEEGNTFTATAYFRDGDTASAPSTAKWRLDCLTTGTVVSEWESLTPANSVSISINPNTMVGNYNLWEKKQITVEANTGSTQTRDTVTYKVKNNRAFTE